MNTISSLDLPNRSAGAPLPSHPHIDCPDRAFDLNIGLCQDCLQPAAYDDATGGEYGCVCGGDVCICEDCLADMFFVGPRQPKLSEPYSPPRLFVSDIVSEFDLPF